MASSTHSSAPSRVKAGLIVPSLPMPMSLVLPLTASRFDSNFHTLCGDLLSEYEILNCSRDLDNFTSMNVHDRKLKPPDPPFKYTSEDPPETC